MKGVAYTFFHCGGNLTIIRKGNQNIGVSLHNRDAFSVPDVK